MRCLILVTLMIVLVFLSFCSKRLENPDYGWTGNADDVKDLILGRVVWFIPGEYRWEKHKLWDRENKADVKEMGTILKLLLEAEKKELAGFNPTHMLSLQFYDKPPRDMKIFEVHFDPLKLRSRIFVGSVGVSYELGKLLKKYLPEEAELVIPGIDPNRIRESQERLQEQAQRLKETELKEKEP